MKTELEIANERILELEEQVKKLTSNTVLPAVGSRIKFKRYIQLEGKVKMIADYFGTPQIIIDADTCKIVDAKYTAYPLAVWEATNCR